MCNCRVGQARDEVPRSAFRLVTSYSERKPRPRVAYEQKCALRNTTRGGYVCSPLAMARQALVTRPAAASVWIKLLGGTE